MDVRDMAQIPTCELISLPYGRSRSEHRLNKAETLEANKFIIQKNRLDKPHVRKPDWHEFSISLLDKDENEISGRFW